MCDRSSRKATGAIFWGLERISASAERTRNPDLERVSVGKLLNPCGRLDKIDASLAMYSVYVLIAGFRDDTWAGGHLPIYARSL
jgi:hypothetical protein